MRFAYIDSKGKEIELDSVEALALRIELGAITDETKLYDASQDRWAPAKEHPIFQSLSSGKPVAEASEATAGAPEPAGGGGPPKPKKKAGGPPKPKKKAEAPPEAEEAPEEEAPVEEEEAPVEEEAAPEEPEIPEAASAFMGPEMEGAKAEVHEPEPAGDVEPVSFADVMEDEEEAPEAEAEPEPEAEAEPEPEAEAEEAASFEMEGPLELEEVEEAPGDDVLDMDLDLVEAPEEEVAEPDPAGAPASEPEDEAPSFEMEGPLELEEDQASPTVPGTEEPEPDPAETPAGGGAGMDLEGALDWAGLDEQEGAVADEAAAGAKPEREKTEMFGPEEPAAGDRDEPDAGEGLELEPAHAAAATAEPEAPVDEEGAKPKRKRPSGPRPSHWEDRKIGEGSGGVGKLLVGLVLVAALGAGGWYFLMGPGASREEVDTGPDLPPAPGLQAELVPTMNEMAGPAVAALVERTDALWSERGAPEAPGQSWLTGPYFASASEYGYIEEYWEAIQSFVGDLREDDDALFRETLETRLQEALEAGEVELSEAEMAAILDRAGWEFMAATAQADPYAPLDSLAAAALDLHALLLSRESDILTEDEAGGFGSADPILEVIVQDDTLRSAMNDRLDEVLRTMAETEAPAPVTTRGLMAALYEKVRAAAFP